MKSHPSRADDNPQRGHLSGFDAILTGLSFFVVLTFAAYFVFVARTPSLLQSVRGDFPEWVIGARLVREAPDRLYDLALQQRQYRALTGKEIDYPYLYPPFVAALFVPITAFPFYVSFLLWAIVSAALYVCAVALAAPAYRRFEAIWLALASPLFLWYTLVYGQLSALACAAIAGAIWLERRGYGFWSGVAAGLCMYKPPLLLWIVPMVLVTRRLRALSGILASAVALAGISLASAGRQACLDWLRILFRWTGNVSAGGARYPVRKYVDLNACIKLFDAQPKGLVLAIAALAAAGAIAVTVRAWRRGPVELRWAATLTLTLLVNVYAPIYDAVLLMLAILLAWRPESARACALFMVAAHIAAWASEDFTGPGRPPPVTIVLIAFVLYQWVLGRRLTHVGRQEQAAPGVAAPA